MRSEGALVGFDSESRRPRGFKVPRYVRFVEEFPMTVTGKIQKFRMREVAIVELGLEEAASVETA
jgi:fatty-acyl-CoA synthase